MDNPAATTAGILQVDGIDPDHDRKRGITESNWFASVGGSSQSKQLKLAANRELPVDRIDQHLSFMGIRAAENFLKPIQLRLEFAHLLEQISFLGLALVLGM